MSQKNDKIVILIADDDPDDRFLTEKALRQNSLRNDIRFVENGEEVLDYLLQKGKYNADNAPRPGLILLDLNMPKMDGREALAAIKKMPQFKNIPIVILTSSKAESDILQSYELGGNSFITKPVTFEQLVEVIREIGRYWFEIVDLPNNH